MTHLNAIQNKSEVVRDPLSMPSIKVLLVEDNPGDARLIRELLKDAKVRHFSLAHADRLSTGVERAAEGGIDAILLDLSLPDSYGLETVSKIYPYARGVPILVLTGFDGETVGLEAVQQGAQDYLVKGQIDGQLLARSILYAIERKVQEDQLREHARVQAQLLTQALTAQEAERRRLSRDIHDGPLQSLGVALIALDRSIRRHQLGDYELAQDEERFMRATLLETVDEIRAVLADLSLEVLTAKGLVGALSSLIDRFTGVTGIEVTVTEDLTSTLRPETELLLYRLAQEALANVRKHSHAQIATISLVTHGGNVHMTVHDDGRGFDPETALQHHDSGQGIGLRSMRERVELMGGKCNIDSATGKGATLEFWCPIELPTTEAARLVRASSS
jgi:signal transduction histidine kinase